MSHHQRIAKVTHDVPLKTVQAYMPGNYQAWEVTDGKQTTIWIQGHDYAGWTLDGYVIPRLASGLIFAEEIGPGVTV
jgi:hypothetical protein